MEEDKKLKVIDGETLLDMELAAPRFCVQGLLPQGLTILGGAPKIGKSWLVLDLCVRIAKGEPMWGMETTKGTTLYLCLEDPYFRIQQRLNCITDEAPDNVFFASAASTLAKDLEQQIVGFVREHPDTVLIVIDTFQMVRSGSSEPSYGGDYQELQKLKRLSEDLKLSILLVHHLRKMSDKDPLNKLSGTTGISGAVDAVFILTKDDRNQNTAKLVCTGRDIEHQEFELAFSKEACVWEMLLESAAIPRPLLPLEMVKFVAFMKEMVCFRGSSTELAERFNTYADLSMAVKGMKQMMNRYRSQLREQGVSFQNHRSNGLRTVEVFYSFENGKKLRQDPSTLKKLRQLSDEICQTQGLSVLNPYQSGGQNLSAREYRTAKKGESWKFRLMYHIGKAMEQSLSREDFIILMNRKGYEVNWTEERKHITFTCPNGMKCRGSRLHHEKYAKENFENEFAIRQQLTAHRTGTADTAERRSTGDYSGDTLSTHRLGNPGRDPEARAAVAGACNGVSTGTVPDAQSAADPKRAGANDSTVRPSAEGSQRTDDELHTDLPQTGWERERTAFLRHLEDALGQSASHGVHSNRTETQSAKTVRHYGSGFGSGLGAGLRGLAVASQIIDDEEDPEEWRKCIEAEQNGSNLGAALGFAIGAVMALSEEQEEVNEYYVEEAIWQQTM